MKELKKFLAVMLAALSVFAVGCNKDKENATTNGGGESIESNTYPRFEDGLHELNYTETNESLVKNNKTEYAILVPADLSAERKAVAEDLKKLFYEATKCDMRIVKDDTVGAYSADKKYISLGDTTYAAAINAKGTPELERYGYSIKTIGKSIFINANTDVGVSFGVYGFLQLQFNFDCFSDQYYIIDKKDDAPLLNFAVRNVPDLGGPLQSTSSHDGIAAHRMGLISKSDFCMPQATNTVHASMYELPVDTYYEAHPKWYAANRKQLCYTARGDAAELDALHQIVADKIIEGCKKSDTDKWAFSFGQADTPQWCTCPTCTESLKKYGSDCAVQIKFINEVARRVQEWMETEEGKPHARNFAIRYLVYHKSIEAPVKFDEASGKWVPIDETVIPAEHTMPQMAPLDMDHLCDLDSECNEGWVKRLEKWENLLEHSNTQSATFSYYRNYTSDLLYFDSYTNLQNMYRFYAEMDPAWFYDEGNRNTLGETKWEVLKGYLYSKITWDVNLDIEDLTEKFFQYYYGEAGDEMYDVFRATRAVWGENRLDMCDSRSKMTNLLERPELYPEELAVTSLEKIEKGLSDIKYLQKIDPAKYDIFYKNIVCERVSYEFMLIHFYEDRYDPAYIQALKLQTKRDAELNEITAYTQTEEISVLWNKWGI